jgi:hypothetical protein
MGRWLEKVRKDAEVEPTKLTEPSFVSFVSNPQGCFQEKTSPELTAANESCAVVPPSTWLLLVLHDGHVIQQCVTGLDMATASIEQRTCQQYGDSLLSVVTVPGFERPLSEEEIVKALAGTLGAPAVIPVSTCHWLPRVAQLLGVLPTDLLEGGYLDAHDLIEQTSASAEQLAEQIRRGPAWIARTDTYATRTH